MPRFYFDLREDGTVVEDEEGVSLPDLATAEREAAKAVTEIGYDRLPEGGLSSVTIDVRDENGDHILSATVSLEVKHVTKQGPKGRSKSGDTGEDAGPP